MKTKWMMTMLLLAAVVMCFSTPARAMTLDDLEEGAKAAVKHLGSGAKLDDDEAQAARNFEQYVRNFYRWIPLIGIYAAETEAEVQRTLKLVPTEPMRDTYYFSKGIGEFIHKYKPEGLDMKSVQADGVVLAWYLSQHPNSRLWQKAGMGAALINAFGEDYPGRAKVEEDIAAARKLEGKAPPPEREEEAPVVPGEVK